MLNSTVDKRAQTLEIEIMDETLFSIKIET